MMMERRRAVSHMIGILILVGITVLGGAAIYSLYMSLVPVSTASAPQLEITEAQAFIETPGQASVAITLRNSGTVAVTSISESVNGNASNTLVVPLGPGVSTTAYFTLTAQPGQQIVVTFTAFGSQGGTYTITDTVTVQ